MADKIFVENENGDAERKSYKQGIKDADAVGFAEWIEENAFQEKGKWFNRYDNEQVGNTTEELYLTYLKTKTK